ncbi:MAG: hypothetical protein HC921_11735 [Synechococcaceae cyanobacterium SM2_3_1]|nr:hypothetical protein [Synechococcaceae cyanobacterium SM2_3_1]
MRIDPISPTAVIEWARPVLIQAGAYALQVQQKVGIQPAKEGKRTLFAQALTDADLSIQTFVEVAALARYPQLGFFGEEEDTSYNMKYFPASSPYTLLLDPVDGTRFYMDQHPNFNLILSLLGPEGLLGAIVHMPGLGQMVFADQDRGAWLVKGEHTPEPLNLNPSQRLVVTYRFPEAVEKLSPQFHVIDIAQDYDGSRPCPSVNAIFWGESCAFLGNHVSLIDWGAMAYIVAQAGGGQTDRQGSPLVLDHVDPRYRHPTLVASANPEIHQQILTLLNS